MKQDVTPELAWPPGTARHASARDGQEKANDSPPLHAKARVSSWIKLALPEAGLTSDR